MHGSRFVVAGDTLTRPLAAPPLPLRVDVAIGACLAHDRPALVDAATGTTLTGNELLGHIRRRRDDMGLPPRSLVALTGHNTVDFIVTYLALLLDGHVPLLTSSHVDDVASQWECVAAITNGDPVRLLATRRSELHDDLALVMATSGSTGAPKLVRLSHRNVLSNAEAIIRYLGIDEHDRAITTLPPTYCYGLSVVHSHLLAGGSLVVGDYSVADPCWRAALDDHSVTNFAGVPYTFELLSTTGFDPAVHPGLRFATQAGGKMAADDVRRWSTQFSAAGADLFVMYGQTEATARMAFLPPELAADHPDSIGVPIPGGSVRIDARGDLADKPVDVGEIVYGGPNVMMGYAHTPRDLARGADIGQLRTGDLGRIDPGTGLLYVVGRTARFIKPFGVRLDLDAVERWVRMAASDAGTTNVELAVTGSDDLGIVVGVVHPDAATATATADHLTAQIGGRTGLPPHAVHICVLDELPRTSNGKPDAAALLTLATTCVEDAAPSLGSVAALYAASFGRTIDTIPADATFVALGGDSLRYVEVSTHLESMLAAVPDDWHLRTVGDLDALARSDRPRRWSRVDTTLVLRAIGICAVVATHMRLYRFPGGAHLLLAVSGYNLARFHVERSTASALVRNGLRSAARIGVPTSLWIGVNMAVVGGYSLGALGLVNTYFGSAWRTEGRWRYWYMEVLVHLILAATLLLLIPAVRRLERRAPYLFALGLLAVTLLFRFELVVLGDDYNAVYRTHTVAWFFVLGWLVLRSTTVRQRLVTTGLVLATIPGFFDRPQREWFIVVGLVVLVWARSVPIPRPAIAPIATLAAASMWIFLLHWQVWPVLDSVLLREWAYVATILTCTALWWVGSTVYGRANKSMRLLVSHRSPPRSET